MLKLLLSRSLPAVRRSRGSIIKVATNSAPAFVVSAPCCAPVFLAKHAQTARHVSTQGFADTGLDFTHVTSAFESKTNFELYRALLVFRLCESTPLVKHSKQLVDMSYRLFGKRITNAALEKTFFGHFCAGIDGDDIQPKIQKLEAAGIGSILDYAAEADVAAPRDVDVRHLITAKTFDYRDEELCDKNAEITMMAIKAAAKSKKPGFAAVKLTSLGKPELLEHVSHILNETRRTFRRIVHHEIQDEEKHPSLPYMQLQISFSQFKKGIEKSGIKIAEDEARGLFDVMNTHETGEGLIDYLEWTSYLNPVTLSMGKLSSFRRVAELSEEEVKQMTNMMQRLDNLAKAAYAHNVMLLIDAEQTYFQPAIDHCVISLQRKFNRERPVIYNTFQCYLTDSAGRIQVDLARARREGFHFACKLVRGAYLIQEGKRAEEQGYRNPVYITKNDTDRNFDAMVKLLIDNNNNASFMVASHNEKSIYYTAELMSQKGIKREGGIYFGQLLGMCDHVTYSLGHAGYQVYKYLPYGPVDEVVPYLIRRAQENSGVMSNVAKEKALIMRELARRRG